MRLSLNATYDMSIGMRHESFPVACRDNQEVYAP